MLRKHEQRTNVLVDVSSREEEYRLLMNEGNRPDGL